MWYEIVWTYLGHDYVLATHIEREAAYADYQDGRSRVFKLIHGGKLRIDEVWSV